MNSDEGARLKVFLAEAVRRSRGFRKPTWTRRDQQRPAEVTAVTSETIELKLCRIIGAVSYLSALSTDGQRLSKRGALVLLPSRRQVDF